MAKSKSPNDAYTSQAVFNVTESGANTLTFEKLETGLSIYDKIGWVISRIEYKIGGLTLAQFNGTGDTLTFALTMTNTLTALAADNPAVLFQRAIVRHDIGTAASGLLVDNTWNADYSTLPGGGLLVLPNPLYFGVVGASLAGAATIVCRIFFQALELTEQDYFNLVQARQLLVST